MDPAKILIVVVAALVVLLTALLASSKIDLASAQSDIRVLQNDNLLQGQVIAIQAFNFNRFNQIAEHTSHLNSLISASTEKKVIEYREILRREKTCDFAVPADIAGGLLKYTHSLRISALHTDTGSADTADINPASSGSLTYCQAVLWINPLLSAIEKANNQLAGIREIEETRASQ
jgi:hypothetical protein